MSHKQHLHKKQHGTHAGLALPRLSDAAHPETGEIDMAKLAEGRAAWDKAIADGKYTLVSGTELGIDEKHDALLLIRRKND